MRVEPCPWRAYSDATVLAVLEMNLAVGADGSPALLLVDDPPNHLWEGLLMYRAAHNTIRNFELEKARRKNERRGAAHGRSK